MDPANVVWIGHATALVELGPTRVLIDPLGRRRCKAAGRYDAILITHAHVDHLNRWTLAALDRSVPVVVPKGARGLVDDLGFASVSEVEVGDQIAVGRIDVAVVGTRHDAGRWRKGDSPICAGYLLARDGVVVHHAGDVDMSDFALFDALGAEVSIDTTLLPIGGMLPVWWYRMRRRALDRGVHIDPDTALELSQRLGARRMVPVHWGTVHLRLGPPSAPRRRLVRVASEQEMDGLVRVLEHGEVLPVGDPDDAEPGRRSSGDGSA